VRRHTAQAQRVVLDGLTVIERGELKLSTQLLRRRLLYAIITDPHGHDCVPGLLGRLLLGDRQHLLQWYNTAQCIKHHHLLLLIGAAVLDDAPESPRLQLHLHHECPIRIIDLGEGMLATRAVNLTNHPLYHNSIFESVIITGSLSSRHLHDKD
jgi:hypothetical protein